MPPDRISELSDRAQRLIEKADATIVGVVNVERELRDGLVGLRKHIDQEIRDLKAEQIADLQRAVQTQVQGKAELWQAMDARKDETHLNTVAIARIQAGAYVFYTALVAAAGTGGFFISLIVQHFKP